jgi:ABC-type branched-subunit amino acid transport system substrate-binding protein
MWDGALAAYQGSPSLAEAKAFFRPVACDDGGVEGNAARIAEQIQLDPRVLAVIGHGTSTTTRAAAWPYAQARIPLIMPIATSPSAAYPPGTEGQQRGFENCFRLPGNDRDFQAPVVAYVAKTVLHTKRAFLIRDVSRDAPEYSGPLYERIAELLSDIPYDHAEFDREKTNLQNLMVEIRSEDADLVIFCGYGSNVQVLLTALRDAFLHESGYKPPKLLMTDGCKINDLDVTGVETYVTFPFPDIASLDCASRDYSTLKESIKNAGDESYQMAGYDAMLILGHAVEACAKTEISRACVLEKVREAGQFTGACLDYSFDFNGENTRCEYCLYACRPTGQPHEAAFRLVRKITRRELVDFFGPGQNR